MNISSIKDKISLRFKETNIYKNNKEFRHMLFWMVLFPPYGVYLMFRKDFFHWSFKVFFIGLLTIVAIGVIDTIYNPGRVIESWARKESKRFLADKNEGEIRWVEYISTDGRYKEFYIITDKGKYLGYFETNESKNGFDIKSLYKVFPDRENIYSSEDFLLKAEVFPEIYKLISGNEEKFGKFIDVISTDKFTQDIKTSLGEFRLYTKYEQVENVYKIEEGNELNKVYSKNIEIPIIPKVEKIMRKEKYKKEYGEIKSILTYSLYKDKQSQEIETSKGIFKFDVYDNEEITISKKIE